MSERNISFYKKNNPFIKNSKSKLELINFCLSKKKKNNSQKNKLYRTEIQTSQRIIKYPSSSKKFNNNNNNINGFITSYTSSRHNSSIPHVFRRNSKKEQNFFEKYQLFVNLNSLLGKSKNGNNTIKRSKYHLNSMKYRKDYTDFIFKHSLLNFKSTQDTYFAHNINSNIILQEYKKLKLDTEKQKIKINKNLIRLKCLKKMENEINDIVDIDYFEYLKLKRDLKKLRFFDNEMSYKKDENFIKFNNYENKINYIYDIYHVPHFKNRLLKYNNEINYEIKHLNELDCPNFIDFKVWINLNIKKVKMQMLKDKGINDNIISENINLDKINSNNKENEKEENDILENEEESKVNFHINEELEDYFINKSFYKSNSYIASDNLKKFLYKNF